MSRLTLIAFVASLTACAVSSPAHSPPLFVEATPTNDPGSELSPAAVPGRGSVIVLVEKWVPRPTEVLAILDFHSTADSEDKGFDELRQHAWMLGAEAVIAAEFEHGEGGAPSHLSGLAVRFLDHQ